MTVALRLIMLLVLVVLAGCGSHDPVWRMKAQLALLQLQREGAETFRPDEFVSLNKTFQQGELLLTEEEDEEQAEEQFKLSYQKGVILKQELQQRRERLKEEARKKEIEALVMREEEERVRFESERKRQEELQETQKNLQKKRGRETLEGDGGGHLQQPSSYTVRRGETLPQIAARPDLYNDVTLWPLIYRANRDQIRDPYQLWPGQILKIPRSFSKEDVLEARKQAQRRGP
jgi:nucleoid-associated protein YgaU